MKALLPVFISLSACSTGAAEFTLDDVVVTSVTEEKVMHCGSYDIKIVSEKFPAEYEMRIPGSYNIAGYYGPDFIIRREAYFIPGDLKLPLPNDMNAIKNTLPGNRTYLPYKAVCNAHDFVIFYESGGNCGGCETLVKFEVIDGKPAKPVRTSREHIKANNP
jgi:hypothetical protein